jgi:hypothetical protein
LKPINLFISIFMLFKILLHVSLFITFSNIIFTSFLVHGIITEIACRALHTILRGITPFSM